MIILYRVASCESRIAWILQYKIVTLIESEKWIQNMYIFHHECLLRHKKYTSSGHKFYMDREKVVCLRVARRFKLCWQKKHSLVNIAPSSFNSWFKSYIFDKALFKAYLSFEKFILKNNEWYKKKHAKQTGKYIIIFTY